jgi:hypothetical protein
MQSARILFQAGLYQMATVAALSLLCATLWPQGHSGVVLGGLIMTLNLSAGQAIARRALHTTAHGGQSLALLALPLKFMGLLAAVTVVLVYCRPHTLAFGLGLTTFFIGLGLATVAHGTALFARH